jgi:hypothetical protein
MLDQFLDAGQEATRSEVGEGMMGNRRILLVVGLFLVLLPAACGGSTATCEGVKSRDCCTEGHPGAPGDCADLIISHRYDQCAFVEDIEGCKPPREWTRQPHGRRAEDWLCPASYEWVDDLDCAGE